MKKIITVAFALILLFISCSPKYKCGYIVGKKAILAHERIMDVRNKPVHYSCTIMHKKLRGCKPNRYFLYISDMNSTTKYKVSKEEYNDFMCGQFVTYNHKSLTNITKEVK